MLFPRSVGLATALLLASGLAMTLAVLGVAVLPNVSIALALSLSPMYLCRTAEVARFVRLWSARAALLLVVVAGVAGATGHGRLSESVFDLAFLALCWLLAAALAPLCRVSSLAVEKTIFVVILLLAARRLVTAVVHAGSYAMVIFRADQVASLAAVLEAFRDRSSLSGNADILLRIAAHLIPIDRARNVAFPVEIVIAFVSFAFYLRWNRSGWWSSIAAGALYAASGVAIMAFSVALLPMWAPVALLALAAWRRTRPWAAVGLVCALVAIVPSLWPIALLATLGDRGRDAGGAAHAAWLGAVGAGVIVAWSQQHAISGIPLPLLPWQYELGLMLPWAPLLILGVGCRVIERLDVIRLIGCTIVLLLIGIVRAPQVAFIAYVQAFGIETQFAALLFAAFSLAVVAGRLLARRELGAPRSGKILGLGSMALVLAVSLGTTVPARLMRGPAYRRLASCPVGSLVDLPVPLPATGTAYMNALSAEITGHRDVAVSPKLRALSPADPRLLAVLRIHRVRYIIVHLDQFTSSRLGDEVAKASLAVPKGFTLLSPSLGSAWLFATEPCS